MWKVILICVVIISICNNVINGYLPFNRLITYNNKKVIRHDINNLDFKNTRIYNVVEKNNDDDWMSNLVEEPDNDLDDAESIDFLQYLNEEYDRLRGSKNALSFDAFIDWPEIRDVLDDEFLELDDLVRIWNETVGSVQDKCSRSQFLDVNEAIDQAV
jgi:hypothetical protein